MMHMQDLNCLIVEDESLAADVISDYIHQVPGLKLKGTCENVFAAMEKLRCEKIDLIFLSFHHTDNLGLNYDAMDLFFGLFFLSLSAGWMEFVHECYVLLEFVGF